MTEENVVVSGVEQQNRLAELVQKLAIYEITKKGFAESSKDIKSEIKEIAGKDYDITNVVKAVVDKFDLEQKAKEQVSKVEEAVNEAESLQKKFNVNLYDEAEKYLV